MELTSPCVQCQGTGQLPWIYETVVKKKVKQVVSTQTCQACAGRGKKLTPAGANLLDFLREFFVQEIENLIDKKIEDDCF